MPSLDRQPAGVVSVPTIPGIYFGRARTASSEGIGGSSASRWKERGFPSQSRITDSLHRRVCWHETLKEEAI